jgi:hypothetical protein
VGLEGAVEGLEGLGGGEPVEGLWREKVSVDDCGGSLLVLGCVESCGES